MAFRELTENEVNMLSERQKQLYLEELELFRERCAFVDRIEELENIKYPEIKPKYVFLSKVKANEAIDISNIKDSKIVIDKVFSPNTIDGKENAGQLEYMIQQMDEKYEISESENIVIAKTIDNKYDSPNNEKVELPTIVIENPDNEADYNFTEVEISDIPELVTKTDMYTNEMKYEKIEVENNISINTSHPEVNFNPEEVGDVNIDLIIKDDYKAPEVFEFTEANVEVKNTKVYMPQEEKIEIDIPEEVSIEKEDVLIAKITEINYGNLEEVKLTDIEKTVLDTPVIDIEVDTDNKIELAKTTNVVVPDVVDVFIETTQVSLDKPIVAKTDVNKEFVFEDKKIENNIDTVVSVASEVEFNMPELIVNDNKIIINNTPSLDEGATDKIMQIINSMGDTYEK